MRTSEGRRGSQESLAPGGPSSFIELALMEHLLYVGHYAGTAVDKRVKWENERDIGNYSGAVFYRRLVSVLQEGCISSSDRIGVGSRISLMCIVFPPHPEG